MRNAALLLFSCLLVCSSTSAGAAEVRLAEVTAQCGSLARVGFHVERPGPVATLGFDIAVDGATLLAVHQAPPSQKWIVNRSDAGGTTSIRMRGGPVDTGEIVGQILLDVPPVAGDVRVRLTNIRAFGNGFGEIAPDVEATVAVDCASPPLVHRHVIEPAWGSGARDGVAGRAGFREPWSVAVDDAGNVFVADAGNHAIRRVDARGETITLAGRAGAPGHADGRGSESLFANPRGIALAPDGSIVVADTGNHTIRRIAPSGEVTTIAGRTGEFGVNDGAAAGARFCFPSAVAVAPDGSVVVADSGYLHEPIYGAEFCGQTIRRIDTRGQVSTIAGRPGSVGLEDGGPGVARFSYPTGLAVDADGTIWVGDSGFAYGRSYTGRTIRRIAPDGTVTTVAGRADAPYLGGSADGTGRDAHFGYPTQIARETSDTLLVADSISIRRVTEEGVVTTVGSIVGAMRGVAVGRGGEIFASDLNGAIWRIDGDGGARVVAGLRVASEPYDPDRPARTLHRPNGVASDANGDALVADVDRVVRVTSDGHASVAAFVAPLDTPYAHGLSGIAAGPDGTIWLTDRDRSCVWRIASDGTKRKIGSPNGWFGWADGPAEEAMFFWPRGIAVAPDGSAWVADTNNHVLRRIAADGSVTTVAGEHGVNETRDGGPGDARFNHPVGLAFGPEGDVWVTESYGAAVRRMAAGGFVTTVAGAPSVEGDADGRGVAARFRDLRGVTVDARGRAWVADGNGMIRIVERDGMVSTAAGGPGMTGWFDATSYLGVDAGRGSAARFTDPAGVAFAPDGRLLVVDASSGALTAGSPCHDGARCGEPRRRTVRLKEAGAASPAPRNGAPSSAARECSSP